MGICNKICKSTKVLKNPLKMTSCHWFLFTPFSTLEPAVYFYVTFFLKILINLLRQTGTYGLTT